jgi:peptidoglycan/xylan/chitin deacetylase (PgdA/CDA1 family)
MRTVLQIALRYSLILPFIFFILFQKGIYSNPKPNEMGKIMILTYHVIGDSDTIYTRSREKFKEDLQVLKEEGFYPIKVKDLEKRRIDIPKGKKPIVLTFDDSSKSQFEMNPDGSIVPTSAVGIMEDFKKKNPDFPLTATFFVLPGAKYPNNLFGQKDMNKQKLEFLINNNYEIANHTLWHANLKKYKHKIEEQIVQSQLELNKYLPDYTMTSLAMPFGIYPPKSYEHKLLSGEYKKKKYKHKLIFDYSNRLSYSVYDSDFDYLRVRRVQAFEGNIQNFIKKIKKESELYYISDGDPESITFPKQYEANLPKAFRKKYKVITY